MFIRHDIPALNAINNLNNNYTRMFGAFERISSGQSINKASDDAARLSISEKLRGQIRGLHQAERNAQDGISLLQTAEGALGEVNSMLNRMREISIQASNGTCTEADRISLQVEMNQLILEISNIADFTTFNGIRLFQGVMKDNNDTRIPPSVSIVTLQPAVFGNRSEAETAINAKQIILSKEKPVKISINMTASKETDGLNGIQIILDFIGTRKKVEFDKPNRILYVPVNNTNDDYFMGSEIKTLFVNMQKDINDWIAVQKEGIDQSLRVSIASNLLDLMAEDPLTALNIYKIYHPIPPLTFKKGQDNKPAIYQFQVPGLETGDQLKILNKTIFVTNKSLTTQEIIRVFTGDSTFEVENTGNTITFTQKNAGIGILTDNDIQVTIDPSPAQSLQDLQIQLQIGVNTKQSLTLQIGAINADTLGIASINVLEQAGISTAIDSIDRAVVKVSSERSTLGAYQNRLEHTINNLNTNNSNMISAESRIRDTDMVGEIIFTARYKLLTDVTRLMLTQYFHDRKQILKLLK